jgi:phage terminase small subunit
MGKYAPRGLSAEAQKLYRETVRETGMDVIDDAASLTLLENGCRALMRLREAEAVLRKEGQTIVDRFGQLKPHPMTVRIDAEGQTIRQSLAGITNHSAAASFKRAQERLHGVGTGDSDPWARHDAI